MRRTTLGFLLAALSVGWAQVVETPASELTGRSIQAIGYPVGGGATTVDFKNTGLIHGAGGKARVEAKAGVTMVAAEVDGLKPPTQLGAEFLTYVLWAVSTEGRAINLGGIPPDKNNRGKLKATTQLQSFSLFVTAEPYSAVRQPSEMLVLENVVRKGTKGKVFTVDDYKLMRRTQYKKVNNPLELTVDLKNVPLEMYEARNAVDIAKSHGADTYAPDIFTRAEGALRVAENAQSRKAKRQDIVSPARQAAQFAEDARALSIDRQEQERIAAERAAAAAAAKAQAEAEARNKAAEESRRQAEVAAARQAQLRAEAAAREAQLQAQAEISASRARAEADALRAKEEAARAEADRARQAAAELRAQLFDQFNRILETRDSARGLIVTIADVLFDTAKFDLRMDARERLARFSGIVLAHPGLHVAVEGNTDSTGGEEYNLKLSQQRARTVRDYLVKQGIAEDNLEAVGYGKEFPVADNSTAAGRQKNRRVELIVSGEVIGVKIGR